MHNLRVAGLTGGRMTLVTARPFHASHHTIADAGRIGGGSQPLARELSLASHGPLWSDERPACTGHSLEISRQPLEDGPLLQ